MTRSLPLPVPYQNTLNERNIRGSSIISVCSVSLSYRPSSSKSLKGELLKAMSEQTKSSGHLVVTIGAGPAGIYGVRKLAEAGHEVVIINRDIKPGGLVEYGIYFNKHKLKEGVRIQFRKILADPRVH